MINEVQQEAAASVSAMEDSQVENGRALTIEASELLLNIDNQASIL